MRGEERSDGQSGGLDCIFWALDGMDIPAIDIDGEGI